VLNLVSFGVGAPTSTDIFKASEARSMAGRCDIFLFNVGPDVHVRMLAKRQGIKVRQYDVFEDLLREMLKEARLPHAVYELRQMARDREDPDQETGALDAVKH